MKNIFRIGAIAIVILMGFTDVWAGDLAGGATTTATSLKTFVAGNTARAGDVNDNFALVREAVNDNDTRIDVLESTVAIKDGILQTNLNADLLDGIDSSSFLRSNANGIHTGTYLQVNGQLRAYGNYMYMNKGSDYLLWSSTGFELSDDLYVAGGVTLKGEVNKSGYSANLLPIAYGYVNRDGSLYANSGNISVTKNSTGQYLITITGESYSYGNYIVAGSVCGDLGSTLSYLCKEKLIVYVTDSNGTLKDYDFAFVVYKP